MYHGESGNIYYDSLLDKFYENNCRDIVIDRGHLKNNRLEGVIQVLLLETCTHCTKNSTDSFMVTSNIFKCNSVRTGFRCSIMFHSIFINFYMF